MSVFNPKESEKTINNIPSSQPQPGKADNDKFFIQSPSITLPKGGGAIKSIDEKFSVNAVNGTSSFSIPLPASIARGFGSPLTLNYSSGAGNGIFGMGWSLNIPSIKRKTEKELPRYYDEIDSDTYIFSGAEDMVPEFKMGTFIHNEFDSPNGLFTIKRYRPRIEGAFARIERWTERSTGLIHWRTISPSNVTSVYGKSYTARITDPADPKKTFEWLIESIYDDKGNCAIYEYKKEDHTGLPTLLHNKNRLNGNTSFTNTYLKRVRQGNITPYNDGDTLPVFLFETVFDYGEHDPVNLPFNEAGTWNFRKDAFSDYRAGFEIRTCRLCRRVLLYHHLDELPGGSALIRSTQLTYDDNQNEGFTFLKAVTETGYTKHDDGTYTQRSLPPFSFEYQRHEWNTQIRSVSSENLLQAPAGIDEPSYQFVDLYSEGLSGMLTEQAGEWLYKSNLGQGHFTAGQIVTPRPSLTKNFQLMDLGSDGNKQLVNWHTQPEGFFELSDDGTWDPFQPFNELPNVDLTDHNTRFLDLDGDGMADILISQDDVFTWYTSEGKKGFSFAGKLYKPFDEEKGPALVFYDVLQSIFLADMSGDGLTDIVRIKNGEVCYWPNLGYGKFGAKINMDNAPLFDHPDQFNPSLIRLADLDGSGTADLVYLGKDKFRFWLNQQGNSFSEAPVIFDPFPEITDHTHVSVIDLLGNGVSCIVWNSNLPNDTGQPLKYIDLFNSRKPHLLTAYKNNLGKEIALEYTASTKFYIEDKLAGTPWLTKLHFPVHCLSKVTVYDRIMKTRLSSSYSYHHGYYDHHEREFRGFGRVDQIDAEDIIPDPDLDQPPVLTKTWFHTGASVDQGKIFNQFEHEYFRNTVYKENTPPDPELPADMTTDEWREALRACKGMLLRKEIYALDGTADSDKPYAAEQHNGMIRMLQPQGTNKYGVFLMHECEAISYHYERNPADPRVAHQFILDIDDYGNILKSADIAHPRKAPQPGSPANEPEQEALHVILKENQYTNAIGQDDAYRTPLIASSKTYELTGLNKPGDYFSFNEIKQACDTAAEIGYEVTPTSGTQKRVIEFERTIYRSDDTTSILPQNIIESKALVHQSLKAVFNENMLTNTFKDKIAYNELQALLTDPSRGGYTTADNYFWMASGLQNYNKDHFYLTTVYTDPFGNTTTVEYDGKYDLYIRKTTDALNNSTEIKGYNYRTLTPFLIQDPNNNRTAVRFDELGLPVRTFILGKKGANEGDLFDDTKVELKDANDSATTKLEYDIMEWYNQSNDPSFNISDYKPKPNYVKTRSRETHYYADPQHQTKWQEAYSYSDGGGHEILKKAQAEPGQALAVQADGSVTTIDTSPSIRWIGNGRVILNNKGNPIKQYEPYFSASPSFDDEKEMVELGVTPIIHYDPIGRVIRTDLPDNTFSKVTFTPWQQMAYDANDTIKESRWYSDRGSPDPLGPEPTDPQTRSAWLAAKHYNTPKITCLDSLGRPFLTIEDNITEKIRNHTTLNIQGNATRLADAYDRTVMQYEYGMTGRILKHISMDAGSRWIMHDVTGKSLQNWDDRKHIFNFTYDNLQRLTTASVRSGDAPPVIYEKIEYGESLPVDQARSNNLLGAVTRHYQQSGTHTNEKFDCKKNLLTSNTQLTTDYKNTVDWSETLNIQLSEEVFTSSSEFDALNRPIKVQTPYTAVMKVSEFYPSYNEASLLEKLEVVIRGDANRTVFISNINYNEKGQRTEIYYGNNTKTAYTYEKETFRLQRILTTRNGGNAILQDLNYIFDPVGNITQVADAAQNEIFYDGEQVKALNRYEYDALYRLISATGRKQAGQTDINHQPRSDLNNRNFPFVNSAAINPNDAQAFRNYTEQYQYDQAGNMLQQQHIAKNSSWTSTFEYGNDNNQLTKTTVGDFSFNYTYDEHGNMNFMEHLRQMSWNEKDELADVDLGGGGHAWYIYDTGGDRARKVIERRDGTRQERLYLGVTEVYREYNNAGQVTSTTESLHIMDDKKMIVLVETKDDTIPLIRYQYDNHLGSVSLELDEKAKVISYEEYFPYGTTSYSTIDATREVPAKRYRYTAKERDEESGLSYHEARYYAPWLGRWTAADPLWLSQFKTIESDDGSQESMAEKKAENLYTYVNAQVLILIDDTGLDPTKKEATTALKWKEAFEKKPIVNGKSYDRGGTTKGATATETLKKYGETTGSLIWKTPTGKGIWMDAPDKKHPTAEGTRYIYTKKGGWLDMSHFMFYAARARMRYEELEANLTEKYNVKSASLSGSAAEDAVSNFHDELNDAKNKAISFAVGEGEEQEYWDGPTSAYSYEDLPSDYFGADFGARYFNPNSSKTLAEQAYDYLQNLKATEPQKAPNWNKVISGDSMSIPPPFEKNYSIAPMYTSK